MLSVGQKKGKKKVPKDPESMECTCVIFPFVLPTDDSYMEIDWPIVKKKYNVSSEPHYDAVCSRVLADPRRL